MGDADVAALRKQQDEMLLKVLPVDASREAISELRAHACAAARRARLVLPCAADSSLPCEHALPNTADGCASASGGGQARCRSQGRGEDAEGALGAEVQLGPQKVSTRCQLKGTTYSHQLLSCVQRRPEDQAGVQRPRAAFEPRHGEEDGALVVVFSV